MSLEPESANWRNEEAAMACCDEGWLMLKDFCEDGWDC